MFCNYASLHSFLSPNIHTGLFRQAEKCIEVCQESRVLLPPVAHLAIPAADGSISLPKHRTHLLRAFELIGVYSRNLLFVYFMATVGIQFLLLF